MLANAYAFYMARIRTPPPSPGASIHHWRISDARRAPTRSPPPTSALGKTLVDTLASEIVNRIYEEGLDDYLYDDFYSYAL